ncbi:MAG: o-succinylbenzoate synthase [Chlamydiia bacterium]|nr:o-succinylbenzoate synthase [Chlamydiia bacterium]
MDHFALKSYRYSYRSQQFGKRDGLIIESTLSSGEKGYGEVAPLPGFSRETIDEVEAAIVAKSISHPLPSLAFGLHTALNKKEQTGEFQVAGLAFDLESAKERADEGFGMVKVKVGEDISEVIGHLQSCGIGVRIDFNRKGIKHEVIDFLKGYKPGTFDLIEEPTLHPAEWKEIYERTGHFLAVDESFAHPQIPWECINAIVHKPTIRGPILPNIAGKRVVLSSSYESPVGILGILQLSQTNRVDPYLGIDTLRDFDAEPPFSITPKMSLSPKMLLKRAFQSIPLVKERVVC